MLHHEVKTKALAQEGEGGDPVAGRGGTPVVYKGGGYVAKVGPLESASCIDLLQMRVWRHLTEGLGRCVVANGGGVSLDTQQPVLWCHVGVSREVMWLC